MMMAMHLLLVPLTFLAGAAVGSFVNVCVYRIPWEKSIIWPDSRCPRCLSAIQARDNLPILGWLFLKGKCRNCHLPISARYPAVEALVALLFVGAYLVDVAAVGDQLLHGDEIVQAMARAGYHQILLAFLTVATFIDYDLFVIPDEVTVPGMLVGVLFGAVFPWLRPVPAVATSFGSGLGVGLIGLVVGGLLVWVVRFLGSIAFRKEAMGFGDVTFLAMIGAFLGWQGAVLTFFLAPFFGLAHALWKVIALVAKKVAGVTTTGADHELPFGPYLSMAAATLVLCWPWLWPRWAGPLFDQLRVVCLFLVGLDT
jgi:leader peptidase (prepilin peptidase)/N-methyltransferase